MAATHLPLNDKPLDLRLGPGHSPGVNQIRLLDYDFEKDERSDDEKDLI